MSPVLGKEVNKDPGHACVYVAQGSQGLAWTRLPAPRQGEPAYITKLSNVGCLWPRKITKSIACISPCHLVGFKKKKKLKQPFSEIKLHHRRVSCGMGPQWIQVIYFSSDQSCGEPSSLPKLKAGAGKALGNMHVPKPTVNCLPNKP